jgi:two-component system NarL family sensor kinase
LHGKKRIYYSTLSKIQSRFEVQEGILVISKDVTKERNMEGEILNTIIDTEEKERRRLANDLHDALGQELNSVKMMFESLILMDKRTDRFKEVLELCKNTINGCIENTRSLSYDLMPKTLEDEKLFNAFEELEKSHRGLLNIILIIPEKEYDISKVRKINIFRIVQEFITNTLKHSGANELIIESFIEDHKYCFEIMDNGSGFDVKKKPTGSGLRNIKTRLKVIDSSFELSSSSTSGTKLKFCIS